MAIEVHARFTLTMLGLTLASIVSAGLAQPQSPPQQVPNMGQQITPLALQGWQFQGLAPDLGSPMVPGYLASQAVTSVVSPDHMCLPRR